MVEHGNQNGGHILTHVGIWSEWADTLKADSLRLDMPNRLNASFYGGSLNVASMKRMERSMLFLPARTIEVLMVA